MIDNVKLSAFCMNCLIQKQLDHLKETVPEQIKSEYMKKVFNIIVKAETTVPAPVLFERIGILHKEYFGEEFSFDDLKKKYNHLMLIEEASIREIILASPDPLYAAILYARIGNYIDFGTLIDVSTDKLKSLLQAATTDNLPLQEYKSFQNDLNHAKQLVYLTDNCGEIVLDKLLIETLQSRYQNLDITVIVRGKPILNDATMEDAKEVGLLEVVRVIHNGSGVAGTWLEGISKESLDLINSADVIISKGQGNFETLNGCGKNIYYMFLCKCEWFVKRFALERFKGVFVNDKNIVINN